MTTAAQAMAAATARLRAAGVPDPARDARLLLAHAAKVDATRVTLIAPEDIAPEIADRFDQLVSLRAVRVPVSHLVGQRAFYGRDFKVSEHVLDPRPETETLIDAALSQDYQRVLDLGIGSGCILVTLLAERANATGCGVDLSESACLQAATNAVLHNVDRRAEILQGDWFAPVSGRFDLIVSNPPYLSAFEMTDVSPELQEHEPRMALTDECDGLSVYRTIADNAGTHLTPYGRVLCEIGWQQGADVKKIFENRGWGFVKILPDLDRRDRVVVAQNPA